MCEGCGRKFLEEAYMKHSKVCQKVFQSQRKAFDSKKKRIIDSDHEAMLKHKEMEEKKKGKNSIQNKQKNQKWKKQSEEFRNIIKQGRELDSKGGKVPFVNVPSSITDDYKHCIMCDRKYNENAYTKHLPTCERRTREAQMNNKGKMVTASHSNKPNLNVRFKNKI